jgi:malonate-semialdehyde dehydrogenase (acetylating)/methylmalonate-semialdehyde dehydrogenase
MAISVVVAEGNVAEQLNNKILVRLDKLNVGPGIDLASRLGFFVGPCLLDGVRPGTRADDDEIFGPVLGVTRVDSYADAVQMINQNPYGNGVAIFTRDGNAARLFSRQAIVGMIGVNGPIPVPIASYSFGGWKNSLFGHSHIYGPEDSAFYTRAKVITTRWPHPPNPRSTWDSRPLARRHVNQRTGAYYFGVEECPWTRLPPTSHSPLAPK